LYYFPLEENFVVILINVLVFTMHYNLATFCLCVTV